MIAVVDASSTVAYLTGVGTPQESTAILEDGHAPALLDVETVQTLRGLLRGGKLRRPRADEAFADLQDLPLRRQPISPLLRRAWELRDRCSACDALYVALAEALDAPLFTRDARLDRAAGDLVDIRLTP